MIIFDAIAATNNYSQKNFYSIIVMMIVFALVLYLMILRPQQKKMQANQKLIKSISQGDEILTAGGLVGYVVKVTDTNYIVITLNNTQEVILNHDFIVAILPKGTIKNYN